MLRYEVTFVPLDMKPRQYFRAGVHGVALRKFIEWRDRKDRQSVFIQDLVTGDYLEREDRTL